MKVVISACLLVLLGLPAYAEPPYAGTVFINPDILLADDPSTFVQSVAAGSGTRQMYDRRINEGAGSWVILEALLFNAYYTDGEAIEIQVNPEFGAGEAAEKAAFYGHAIGQLPLALRVDVQTVWIHKGDQAFGGGNNNILIHTDAPGYHGQWLEEALFHEACHTSLDSRVANRSDWLSAQSADPEFVSTYARDNPNREDVAETCLMHFAVRYREDRISASTLDTINETIPNRAIVLDSLNIKAIVSADRSPYFDELSQQLILPSVRVGESYYEVTMSLIDAVNLLFVLDLAIATSAPSFDSLTGYANGVLIVPLVLASGQRYAVTLNLENESPIQFRLTGAELH
ncbi:MAG: hypothetical protein VB977_01170 [Pseudohongiellaceae bacterium]